MRAAEHALRFLAQAGVRYIFGIPGGSVSPMYDALNEVPELQLLMSRHEAAAALTAASYARNSGQLGVVMSVSGPGATNLLSGCASAMRERLPLLALTGQVRTDHMGLNAAQESSPWTMDMAAGFRPFTKASIQVPQASELTRSVRMAMRLALSAPQGPVHLSLPLDVQRGEVGTPPVPELGPIPGVGGLGEEQLALLVDFLSADAGVILAGSGVRKARATQAFGALARRLGWPVVTSAAGKGSYPEDDPLGMGVYGQAGTPAARHAVARAERVLVLGSSLGETATASWSSELAVGKRMVHIDLDPAVLGRQYEPHLAFVADLREVLRQLLAVLPERPLLLPPEKPTESSSGLIIASHLEALAQGLPQNARLSCDIGEHMMWALHYWRSSEDGFDISINYGGMGSGIANSLGSYLADQRPTVCLTGDGCFAMHGSEVMTALQYRMPIVFVVLNNSSYGMVRWGHRMLFGRTQEEFDYGTMDIATMARGMGVRSFRVDTLADWPAVLREDLFSGDMPTVIDLRVPNDDPPPMGDRVRTLKGG
jgi:acetolactate synthase-1/2/3 large subunit